MNAVDLDTGNNARLTYRLVNGNQPRGNLSDTEALELFGIFPNSGWIYLRGMLDRETRDRYDLTVLVSDNGTPSASATARVIVNVMDSNDNEPKFLRLAYEFTVEENLRRGAVVGVIQAKDDDLDVNAAIRYSLIPSNSSFQINPISGEFNLIFYTSMSSSIYSHVLLTTYLLNFRKTRNFFSSIKKTAAQHQFFFFSLSLTRFIRSLLCELTPKQEM